MLKPVIALAALAIAQPALAQDGTDERPWSVAVTGGTTTLEGEGGQPYAQLSVTRAFGDAYVQVAATAIDSGDESLPAGLSPARTYQGTLAGGYSTGTFSIDVYGSLGVREFDRASLTGPGGQTIALESDGSTAGAGLTLTYDFPLDENLFVSPFVSADYNSIDVARVAILPGGQPVSRKESEDGITGTAGATLQRLFGRHSIALYGAFVTTSNSASSSRGTGPAAATRVGRLLDRPGGSDSWGEYGATGVVGLSDRLDLELSAVRTAGFELGEATSLAAGLRLKF